MLSEMDYAVGALILLIYSLLQSKIIRLVAVGKVLREKIFEVVFSRMSEAKCPLVFIFLKIKFM